MAVVHSPDTEYAKESVKHEAYHTQYGAPGRPYVYREYPAALYRCTRSSNMGVPTFELGTAKDDHERRVLEGQGFVSDGQGAALEAFNRRETEHGKLAAERNYEVAHGRLSEKAVAEVKAEERAAGARHLPEIVEKPKRAYTRKATPTV